MKTLHQILFLILITINGVALGRELSVTVYNRDFGLINDKRTFQFPIGVDTVWISDIPRLMIPASVRFSAPNAFLVEQKYDSNWQRQPLSIQYNGKFVEVETIDGLKLSGLYSREGVFPYMSMNGTVSLVSDDTTLTVIPVSNIKLMNFPLLTSQDTLRSRLMWLIDSETNRSQDVQFSYLTGGMSWGAEYNLAISEGTTDADFSGWVSIDNRCGMDVPNASVKLVAGEIHRIQKKREKERIW